MKTNTQLTLWVDNDMKKSIWADVCLCEYIIGGVFVKHINQDLPSRWALHELMHGEAAPVWKRGMHDKTKPPVFDGLHTLEFTELHPAAMAHPFWIIAKYLRLKQFHKWKT